MIFHTKGSRVKLNITSHNDSVHQELVACRLDACLRAMAVGDVSPTVLGDWSIRVVEASMVFDPNFSDSESDGGA